MAFGKKAFIKTPNTQTQVNQLSFIAEAAVEYFITILVSGAFLASILKNIGVPDSVTGVTTALSSFGFSAQLIAVLFIRPKGSVKIMVTIMHFLNQLMFVTLYLIPYINVPQSVKIVCFIVMFLGGHLIANMASPFKLNWLMSYVPDYNRGQFTANKEIISLLGGMIFSYVMGGVIDYYDNTGNSQIGFIISGITIFVLCILHLISLIIVKDDKEKTVQTAVKAQHLSIKKIIDVTLFDKKMSKIILLDVLWHFATGISFSFFGTYTIGELGFSLKFVAVITAVQSVVRIFFSIPMGKLADKTSWARMMLLSFSIGACAFFFNSFTVPANGKVFYVIFLSLYAIYLAGTNSGMMNITFDYVSHEHRPYALGVKSSIGGIAGFLASLVGAYIVNAVQANNNTVFGITIYAQQILSLIAALIFVFIVFYIKMVILKIERVNDEV